MRVDEFDFELPGDRIATTPAVPRDAAHMLVVQPNGAPTLTDGAVGDLAKWLRPGDALVFNDTRVIASELAATRLRGDLRAQITINLHRKVSGNRWRAFARPAKRLAPGDRLEFMPQQDGPTEPLTGEVIARGEAGEVEVAFACAGEKLEAMLAIYGQTPLPPYIKAKRKAVAGDRADYQTIYARRDGAVAAPTAGLHFTQRLFQRIRTAGATCHFLTLHVGAGTFLPVKAQTIEDHKMHAEWCEIPAETAEQLNRARVAGGRILAVGTTALRVLETAAAVDGRISQFSGETDIFITPGYRFKAVDLLMTNFHLPRSTLLMLVSAFCGIQPIREAYAHAITNGYRFYSYGDACLLHRGERPA